MSIKISQKITLLKCQRCNHVWKYKGKNDYVATCPHCRTYVTLKKGRVLSIENDDHVKESTEYLRITRKNGVNDHG